MISEGFLDDHEEEEAVPERPVMNHDNVRGGEGWKEHEMNLLRDLWTRLCAKEGKSREENRTGMLNKSCLDEEKGLDQSDLIVQRAIKFRDIWNSKWHGPYGIFEDVTLIHPMLYTYENAPPLARLCDTLQIFSAKVIKAASLRWPLHVFGMVAVRDAVDRNRNLIFYRTRDNCQTLTEMDPYLVLTGPTRSVVVIKNDYVIFEVYLKVKGSTENEDEYLMYSVNPLPSISYISGGCADNVYPFPCYSSRGVLDIKLGEIRSSVEATIFVQVIHGSWPDGFHGHFAAQTSNECQNVVLFDFGADKVPVDGDGYMDFSRQVVSVELEGSLKVYFMAWQDDKSFEACRDDNEIVNGEVWLKPEKAGRSYAKLSLGSCVMNVLVAWSLVLPELQRDTHDRFEHYPCRS